LAENLFSFTYLLLFFVQVSGSNVVAPGSPVGITTSASNHVLNSGGMGSPTNKGRPHQAGLSPTRREVKMQKEVSRDHN